MLTLSNLQQWFLTTPLGASVLKTEEIFYHNNLRNIFGYYSLQVALPQINFLQGNKISSQYGIDRDVHCDTRFLPFATDSIDLIVCPHTLEFTANYHYFLQECYRVLIPKGKIIISNFNQKSLFGLFGKSNDFLKHINYVSLNTLSQQLTTLNFQICGGKFFGYYPPLNNKNHLKQLAFLDKIGDRWLPTFANSYGIIASKEIITPTFIKPKLRVTPKGEFAPSLGIAGNRLDLYK